jgi:two-component system phosphate regulon sensor histidine kinase PhoR
MAQSLSKRIFRIMLGFVLSGIFLFSLALTGIFYLSFEHDASAKLTAQASQAATLLNNESTTESKVQVLEHQANPKVRYTLIEANGMVAYDSATASSELSSLENHNDRPEVAEARSTGEGITSRYSATLGADTLYAAAPLNDGMVVRLSETRWSLGAFFLHDVALPLVLVMLAAVLLVLVVSRLLTRSLMRPLNNLDVANPLQGEVYAEMKPLVTRIDAQQRLLRDQNKRLEEAESMRRDFSANVSHEMKTPLQVISGYAELMSNGLVPEQDIRQFSGVIYEEAQAMSALINDVLVLSHLDEASGDLSRFAPVDMNQVAYTVAHRLQAPADKAHVFIEVEVPSAPVMVQGVETLLEQMVYNLVDNAVRYNHPGGSVKVRVEEGVWENSQCAVITVRDTGAGIPASAYEHIFERFYRLDKSRSKETGGTGLGLAIVKHAALHHGGQVQVESVEGEGTTFTVYLPQEPVQEEA